MARDALSTNFGRDFEQAFGKKTGKALLHSTAGRYDEMVHGNIGLLQVLPSAFLLICNSVLV